MVGKYDSIYVRCWFCSREVRYPSSRYRRMQPVFCSRRCNLKFVAREGQAQQENLWRHHKENLWHPHK